MKPNVFLRSVILQLLYLLLFCFASGAEAAGKPYYVGSENCRVCHPKQYESWKNTKMGSAFNSLIPMQLVKEKESVGLVGSTDYTINQQCLSCHTTGFDMKGGYSPLLKDKGLLNVGCEMCHGPGSRYSEIMLKDPGYTRIEVLKAGLLPVNEKTCRNCHNNKDLFSKVAGFDFEKMVKTGIHKHFSMTEEH